MRPVSVRRPLVAVLHLVLIPLAVGGIAGCGNVAFFLIGVSGTARDPFTRGHVRVVDGETGQPVKGAAVTAPYRADWSYHGDVTKRTNADGRARLRVAEFADRTIYVQADGYLPSGNVRDEDEDPKTFDVTVRLFRELPQAVQAARASAAGYHAGNDPALD